MAIGSDRIRRARPLLGTFVEIEAFGAIEAEMVAAVDAAFEAVADVHRLMSFYEPDSDVSRLNREARLRPTRVHAWTFQVLEAAVEMHRRSNGAFDIAVAPALQRMGLLPRTDGDRPIASAARPFDPIELLGEDAVRFPKADIAIDLGGIAKGFAVDRAIEVLRRFAIDQAIVNAGGDLAVFGTSAQTIHIRYPCNPGQSICSIELANAALASSARRFDPFQTTDTLSSAVIDPTTQRPARLIDGATVRAPSCMIADALTKVVMLRGSDAGALLERYNASALVLSSDGDLKISSDWHHAVHLAA